MTAEQQERWRLVADRFQTKPPEARRRLAARIAEWARLSPQHRAHARLNFLELAKRYNPRQRKEHWHAYRAAKPNPEQVAIGRPRPVIVPPAIVQASPGATTVLLSQLFDLQALDDPAEDRGVAAPDPASVDGAGLLNTRAASPAAGAAAELE